MTGSRAFSTWKWRASRGTYPTGDLERGPERELAEDAYADAERWFAEGARHVAISLWTPSNRGWGLADTRDADRYDSEWVVGLDDWIEEEDRAIAEGRA